MNGWVSALETKAFTGLPFAILLLYLEFLVFVKDKALLAELLSLQASLEVSPTTLKYALMWRRGFGKGP